MDKDDEETRQIKKAIGNNPRMRQAFADFGDYMHEKIRKLDEQQSNEIPRESVIFKGISVYVTGYTNPSAVELRRLLHLHGGEFQQYFTSKVTHVIASNLSDSRSKDLRSFSVVKPEWIVRSVEEGRLLNWKEFRLEHRYAESAPDVDMNLNRYLKQKGKQQMEQESPVKTADPDFVSSYFQTSRLHHLSSWKAELQKYSFRKRQHTTKCVVMHVDMDSFFASVGIRDRPELKDKPVGVSHGQGIGGLQSSDVASCNYVARGFGVKNGMTIGRAKLLCPDLVVIPYEFEKYSQVTQILYEILGKYPSALEAVSCDEAFLEVSLSDYGLPTEDKWNKRLTTVESKKNLDIIGLAFKIQAEIRQKTDLIASIGIGESPLLARVATKGAKPGGVFLLRGTDVVAQRMRELRVKDLHGIGYSYEARLLKFVNEIIVRTGGFELESDLTCGDVLDYIHKPDSLQAEFGKKIGLKIFNSLNGRDDRIICSADKEDRKSVSAEINWGVRLKSVEEAKNFLHNLIKETVSRIPSMHWKPGKVTLHISFRHRDAPEEPTYKYLGCGHCEKQSKSIKLDTQTRNELELFELIAPILISMAEARFLELFNEQNVEGGIKEIRGIGVQLSKAETEPKKQIPKKRPAIVALSPKVTPSKYLKMEEQMLQQFKKQQTKKRKLEPQMFQVVNLIEPEVNFKSVQESLDQLLSLIDQGFYERVELLKLKYYKDDDKDVWMFVERYMTEKLNVFCA